jgi:hypothetical protein
MLQATLPLSISLALWLTAAAVAFFANGRW